MTNPETTTPPNASAEAIVKQYGPQTALFLEFGQQLWLFATVKDQDDTFYTADVWKMEALAYIINYVQTHFPDAAHNVISSLCEESHADTEGWLYTLFFAVYEKDLQDPKHMQGTAYESELCASELTRITAEKESPAIYKRWPHHFLQPSWYKEMLSLGHHENSLFITPFDQLLLQAQQKIARTNTIKNNLLENFNASPDSA